MVIRRFMMSLMQAALASADADVQEGQKSIGFQYASISQKRLKLGWAELQRYILHGHWDRENHYGVISYNGAL